MSFYYTQHPPVNKFLIVDLTNGGVMPLQINPSPIRDSKGTNWDDSQVPGLSHPRSQFIAGEARIIRFTAQFYFESPLTGVDYAEVRRRAKWLESLQYPTHAGTMLMRPPAICMIIMGMLYRGIRVNFRQVETDYTDPFDSITLYPFRANVDCVCHELVEQSVSPFQVRGLL